MEGFPFDKFVGLIVFVIVVVSQMWTAYRERVKQQEAAARASVERDMKRRTNDRSAQVPAASVPAPQREEVPDEAEKALRDMLEALGLPPPETPAPQQPAPPPPPVVVAKPIPQPKPYRKPLPAPDPIPHVEEEEGPKYAARPLPKMPLPAPLRQPQHIRELRDILMHRHTAQRAVVLNEILGTPKGLGKL
jgi:outer membrane biosynthesis protein TonB